MGSRGHRFGSRPLHFLFEHTSPLHELYLLSGSHLVFALRSVLPNAGGSLGPLGSFGHYDLCSVWDLGPHLQAGERINWGAGFWWEVRP